MPRKDWYLSGKPVRLDEHVVHIARRLAHHYGVTIRQLLEALVIGCAERDAAARSDAAPALEGVDCPEHAPAPVDGPDSPRQERGKVIDLMVVKRHRQQRAPRTAPRPVPDDEDRRSRARALLHRSQAARAKAVAACERAAQVRLLARQIRLAMKGQTA